MYADKESEGYSMLTVALLPRVGGRRRSCGTGKSCGVECLLSFVAETARCWVVVGCCGLDWGYVVFVADRGENKRSKEKVAKDICDERVIIFRVLSSFAYHHK